MTGTPTFDDLTPPHNMYVSWIERAYTELGLGFHDGIGGPAINNRNLALFAYRAGARHGWEQAHKIQQWPEPITDRPPTEADGDEAGQVQVLFVDDLWGTLSWKSAAAGRHRWLPTLRWQPRQPSLQEAVDTLAEEYPGWRPDLQAVMRRALEQAGEGQS